MRTKSPKAWFTLIELIVVITIIAILATIWFLSYISYTKMARDSGRKVAVNEIAKAVINFDTVSSLKPKSLWFIKNFDQYPIDPVNNLWYQYNVNSSESRAWNDKLWGKWFVVCTNRPLEKYSDDNGNLLPDYLDALDPISNRKDFIEGKLQNRSWRNYTDVQINEVMGYYCEWLTTSFSSLVAWWWNDSVWTENCSQTILDPTKQWADLWKSCKIIFNDLYENQAVWTSPTQWTPFTMN